MEHKKYSVLRACIFGLQNSGKSELAKSIIKTWGSRSVVYDVHGEYKNTNSFRPKFKQYSKESRAELDEFIRSFLIPNRMKIDLFVLDEANRYLPNRIPLTAGMLKLNDDSAHLGLSLICIARRPAQLNTDLVELAHEMFIFKLHGKNDIKYLNDIKQGLGEAVNSLKPFQFIHLNKWREYKIHEPIKMV